MDALSCALSAGTTQALHADLVVAVVYMLQSAAEGHDGTLKVPQPDAHVSGPLAAGGDWLSALVVRQEATGGAKAHTPAMVSTHQQLAP